MFTIGADPELFFRNNNQLISVVGQLGGSKTEPMDIGNGCAIQEDNVAAEFCIPPCTTAKEFYESITYALGDLKERATKLGLSLAELTASGNFSEDQLNNPQAQTFGCDPDYNAYTGKVNPRPKCSNPFLRSAGGHIHVGTNKEPIKLVYAMDLFLGVPSVLLDKDKERRKLYGKAGCFRYKPYGIEYRTLSNFWIWKEETIKWVEQQTECAVESNFQFSDLELKKIQSCINTGNTQTAKKLIDIYDIYLPNEYF